MRTDQQAQNGPQARWRSTQTFEKALFAAKWSALATEGQCMPSLWSIRCFLAASWLGKRAALAILAPEEYQDTAYFRVSSLHILDNFNATPDIGTGCLKSRRYFIFTDLILPTTAALWIDELHDFSIGFRAALGLQDALTWRSISYCETVNVKDRFAAPETETRAQTRKFISDDLLIYSRTYSLNQSARPMANLVGETRGESK